MRDVIAAPTRHDDHNVTGAREFTDSGKMPKRLSALARAARDWAEEFVVPPDEFWRDVVDSPR